MHPNPIFRKADRHRNIDFARQRSFGTLAINSSDETLPGPLLSHIPFVLSEDGRHLEAHLVRSNPILRLLKAPQPAVISVLGPDGYISPDWYGVENQVPTWNYVAVHLRGTLRQLPDNALHGILERLSATMEARLLPKQPWTIDKMDQEIYGKMQRQIVPVAMDISEIGGTWKLSQNKSEAARLGAAKGVLESAIGSGSESLSMLMQRVEPDE
jgi:transcriptional regulator